MLVVSSIVVSARSSAKAEGAHRFRVAIPYLLLAALSAAYLFPFVQILTWNPDEGIYLYGAQLAARGAIPGHDFVELQGPGSFYWLALFFKLFGTSIYTARAVLLLTGVA